MEVKTRSLSNFDLNPKLPFSYSAVKAGTDCSELQGSNMPESPEIDASENNGFASTTTPYASAAAGGRPECEAASVVDFNSAIAEPEGATTPAGEPEDYESTAARKLQKVYRSYRTRRMLADSAVVAEELWWQAIDYARLNHSTISFFNFFKSETAASRWNRISLNASKVGKGLSKDAKAQKLAFQHWIEAIDPRHRYGHCLHMYYEAWCKTDAGQPFFYWLDIGDGKEVDLKECPRSKLRQQCIKYLGPQERERYEFIVVEGKVMHKESGNFLDTNKGMLGTKWIFVMSTSKKLYAGQKKKGKFHHSSFLAGGTTLAAGRFEAEAGTLKSISPYSGHYRPTDDSFDSFLSYLEENGVNLNEVEIHKANEDYENYEERKWPREEIAAELSINSEFSPPANSKDEDKDLPSEATGALKIEAKTSFKRTLSGGLQSPRADVPNTAILQRINSKKAASSYQLGHQLSRRWSTGAGPRIGCIADYPVELRLQALEFVNLSPRTPPTPSSYRWIASLASSPASDNGHSTSTL